MRFTTPSIKPPSAVVATAWLWRRSRRWSLAAAVLLAACGGGTTQYEPFVAGRVLVVGDDLSAVAADGRKFAVNGLTAAGALDCSAEPLWVQSVAALYGFVFAECNPNASTNVNGIMRAAGGAKVADISAQVDTQIAAGGFRDRDLVLALGGMNDVVELFERWRDQNVSSAPLLEEARARGERMAGIVNRLIDLQAKVIVSTVPDLGLSPYARLEEGKRPGSAAFLAELTRVFNERLGVKVLLDGRFVGLMQTDLRTQLAVRFPSGYGLADATTAVCTALLPGCTTATLLQGASAGAYLWADGTRLASGGQSQLASLALDRATRNPF